LYTPVAVLGIPGRDVTTPEIQVAWQRYRKVGKT